MAKNRFMDYRYVDAEVIRRAAMDGDEDAIEIIRQRYERETEKVIRKVLRRRNLKFDYDTIEFLKSTVWDGVLKDIRRFRPK